MATTTTTTTPTATPTPQPQNPETEEDEVHLNEEQERKYNLITQDLAEVVGKNDIRHWIQEGKPLNIYWGTAITGKPHFGYFVPLLKISDFLQAGCHVTILFANLHGFLDNQKSGWELLSFRCEWYEFVIKEMLQFIGVPLDKLRFVRGLEFQLSAEYTMDVYRLTSIVTTEQTKKAAAEVVKMTDAPLMSNLLYPILQALDEQYLGVDIQFGGVDQRKIFVFAREYLPKVGYKKRAHLMNPLIPGLGESGKMSSSEPLSKLELDETDANIRKKIGLAYSLDGVSEGNGLLAILRYVLFRYLDKKGLPFVAPRKEKWGGPQVFKTYDEVEAAFTRSLNDKEKLMSGDLKEGVINVLLEFLAPLREKINANSELCLKAYPDQPLGHNIVVGDSQHPKSADKKLPINFRVGKVLTVEKQTKADTYTLQLDVGEDKPLSTTVAGLIGISADQIQNRLIVFATNLASGTTNGAVLVASNREKSKLLGLDVVTAPDGSQVGERVGLDGRNDLVEEDELSNARLKKVIKDFSANNGVVVFHKDHKLTTKAGPLTSSVLNPTGFSLN